jgi:DNA-directed RNA polymerase specialized sigma24 family protein
MDLATYRALRRQAQRLTRTPDEAEDLVQDTLLSALQAGRQDAPWLAGTLRRQAALQVRAAVRRRRRESAVLSPQQDDPVIAPTLDRVRVRALLGPLPPAARRLATLALHGLNADEVRWILGVSDAAFRQRLTSIRKHLTRLPDADRLGTLVAAERNAGHGSALPFGLIRRALKAALHGGDGLGTHDADGHLIVLRRGR